MTMNRQHPTTKNSGDGLVSKLQRLHGQGLEQTIIAERLGVTTGTVSRHLKRLGLR